MYTKHDTDGGLPLRENVPPRATGILMSHLLNSLYNKEYDHFCGVIVSRSGLYIARAVRCIILVDDDINVNYSLPNSGEFAR